MQHLESFLRFVFIAAILAAAICDFRSRRIPNVLTFGAMAMALAAQCLSGGLPGLATWFLGTLAGGGLLLLPWLAGGMGAGDVKLLAAAGGMLGPFPIVCAFMAASLIGALMALAAVSRRGAVRYIPYGLPLAAGVLLGAIGAWI